MRMPKRKLSKNETRAWPGESAAAAIAIATATAATIYIATVVIAAAATYMTIVS